MPRRRVSIAQGKGLRTMAWRLIAMVCLALAVWWVPAGRAIAQANGEAATLIGPEPGTRVILTLPNGDTLRGEVVSWGAVEIVLQHLVLGEVRVPAGQVSSWRRIVMVEKRAGSEDGARGPAGAEMAGADTTPAVPQIESGLQPDVIIPESGSETAAAEARALEETIRPVWDSDLELGLSGTTGSTERTNLRFNFNGQWRLPTQSLAFRANYLLNIDRNDRTQNRLDLQARNEWFRSDRKWRNFVEGAAMFDEFKEFDVRGSGGAGFGYKLIMNETTDLLVRLGAGVSYPFGAPDAELVPELILGAEVKHKLTASQTLLGSIEAFPDLRETDEYRAIARGAWELKLSGEHNLSLRLGVEYRVDTQALRDRQRETDYFASLIMKF